MQGCKLSEGPNVQKPKVKPAPPTPNCSKVMESCMPHSRCCDPCVSCHCRFFNSICYCWKLG
ncbi:unnamed protein product [Coregonus sp. 'balchen']|nr:unnamed protein product [Coregonus sp. 'balchen']